MNASILAEKMLEWENKKRELDLLEEWIKGQVLELEKTQTVGNVRASYSKGWKSYDYEASAKEWDKQADYGISNDVLREYEISRIDWRGVCKHYDIQELVIASTGKPSVSIKLLS